MMEVAHAEAPSKTMRLLVSATRGSTTLPSEYGRQLQDLGCTLFRYYGGNERRGSVPQSVRRILQRTFTYPIWRQANCDLLDMAENYNPDVVWIFKGSDIYPSTIRKLKQRGNRLISYNADHPFRFFSPGSGNSNVRKSIPEYDLHLTYSRHIAMEMADAYPGVCTGVVPFGHAIDDALYASLSGEHEIVRVCFLGNPDTHRIRNIGVLLSAGINVDVYGHSWDRFRGELAGARIHGAIYGTEMYRTLRRYRVQLNFLRPHNLHSHNMRTFEAPASGAIMLAEDTIEHREFFRPGLEAFYFSSDEELVTQARRLLSLGAEEASEIRRRARLRSVEQPFRYRDRTQLALGLIRQAIA